MVGEEMVDFDGSKRLQLLFIFSGCSCAGDSANMVIASLLERCRLTSVFFSLMGSGFLKS